MKKHPIAAVLLSLALTLPAAGFVVAATDPAPSGFLSDYNHLSSQGPLTHRYKGYADKTVDEHKVLALYLAPVALFPADTKFEDIEPGLVLESLTYLDQQLRLRLADRVSLVNSAGEADSSMQVALTTVAAQPAGKTALDLVPLRLITGPIKNAMMGKALEAVVTIEMQLRDAKSNAVLRETLHHVSGKGIGRSESKDTVMSFEALKPALDRWLDSAVDLIAPKS